MAQFVLSLFCVKMRRFVEFEEEAIGGVLELARKIIPAECVAIRLVLFLRPNMSATAKQG